MVQRERAAAEMVGAIILMIIFGSAIAIIGYQMVSQIMTRSMPYTTFEIACGNKTILPQNDTLKDFVCRSGLTSCTGETYDDCLVRCAHSDEPDYSDCTALCGDQQNCIDPRDNTSCNMLFICHRSGDSIPIKDLTIIINNKDFIPNTTFQVFYHNITTGISQVSSDAFFKAGETICFPLSPSETPLRTVSLQFNDAQFGDLILAKKEFIGN